jgi:hypothetical protein
MSFDLFESWPSGNQPFRLLCLLSLQPIGMLLAHFVNGTMCFIQNKWWQCLCFLYTILNHIFFLSKIAKKCFCMISSVYFKQIFFSKRKKRLNHLVLLYKKCNCIRIMSLNTYNKNIDIIWHYCIISHIKLHGFWLHFI